MLTFEFYRLRFHFRAAEPVRFPMGKAGNTVRGTFGTALRAVACHPQCPGVSSCERRAECDYARIFEPRASGSFPSGLADCPRPFVLRASHLDGAGFAAGAGFHFDAHVFDLVRPVLPRFEQAFSLLASQGLGVGRGRAELLRVERLDLNGCAEPAGSAPLPPLVLRLNERSGPLNGVMVRFVTPTELKGPDGHALEPQFGVLFARLRDRISTLRALYGHGPLEMDFKAAGERAARVRLASSHLEWVAAQRKSGRTGQVHSLGGFTGEAVYEGELAEFLPWLQAGRWVGVGRQTVWGKGEISVEAPR